MKILISVDIEGVAGVWTATQTQFGQPEYERARRWMTAEASAAVRGAFAGGADEVLVADSHGYYANLLADELDPRALLIQGKPRRLGMFSGIEQGVDGVLLIGWHSRSKTGGTLAHSINGAAFARIWLNGLEVGEIGLYAALAAEFGVPVLMISACETGAQEARSLLPQVSCAVVKWAEGARAGMALSPEASRNLIEKTACDAVRQAGSVEVQHLVEAPVTVRLQCQMPAQADVFALWPALRRDDAETVSFDCASVEEAVRSLNALSVMATSSVLR